LLCSIFWVSENLGIRQTVYDGDNPYADFDASGALANQYLYLGSDQLIARIVAIGAGSGSDGIVWCLTDILGSVYSLRPPTRAIGWHGH